MKRLLAFLLLFGSGLALLIYLQDRSTGDATGDGAGLPVVAVPEGTEPIPIPTEVQLPGELGDVEPGTAEAAEATAAPELPVAGQVSIGGPITHVRYADDGEVLFRLTAVDSRTAEQGLLGLTEVVIEHPGRGRVTAAAGRVLFEAGGGRLALGGPEDRIELVDARVDLPEDHALAPLVLSGGLLLGRLGERTFELAAGPGGAGRPRLDGRRIGLDADRIGIDLVTGRLTASGDGLLTLSPRPRPDGSLPREQRQLAAETITIEELAPDGQLLPDGSAPAALLQLDALGSDVVDARLTLTAAAREDDLVLWAPHLTLVARQLGSEQLSLETLTVDGEGRLERAGGIARGDDLQFTFARGGEAGQVVLAGQPSLSFPEVSGGSLAPASSSLGLTAAGPLTLTLDGALEFSTEARAVVSWGDWSLASDGGLRGMAEEDATHIALSGRGGVALAGELGTGAGGPRVPGLAGAGRLDYSTETVELDYRVPLDPATGSAARAPGPGWPRVELVGTGATAIEATDAEGYRAQVTCADGLTLLLEGERWSAPAGRQVQLELETPTGSYTGQADELLGLDPTALRLDVRGGAFVQLEGVPPTASRSGQGSRIVLDGEDQLQIQSAAGQRARYEEGGSLVEARRFERRGGRLTADGSVRARLALDELQLDFRCGSLELFGLDPDGVTGREVERIELRGDVRGEALLGEQRLELELEELDVLVLGESVALPDGDAPEASYELHGRGPVRLGWRQPEADWTVTCAELDVYAAPAPDSDPSATPEDPLRLWLELVATGEVRVSEELEAFVGHGDVLHLDHGAVDRALLEGQPAKVSGRLPGLAPDGAPLLYRGEVARLALLDRELEADGVDLELFGLGLPGMPLADELTPPAKPWRARSQSLRAEAGRIQLDGQVRFDGEHEGVPVLFQADHAGFVNLAILAAAQPPEDLDSTVLPGTSFIAFGQVQLRRGTEYEVSGDELSIAADTRELRLSGNPARALYAGLCSNSRWVRLDPTRMTLDSGPGVIHVDPVLLRSLRSQPQPEGAPR